MLVGRHANRVQVPERIVELIVAAVHVTFIDGHVVLELFRSPRPVLQR
jgi:prepilin-type processing-associated H-X9-DG protein